MMKIILLLAILLIKHETIVAQIFQPTPKKVVKKETQKQKRPTNSGNQSKGNESLDVLDSTFITDQYRITEIYGEASLLNMRIIDRSTARLIEKASIGFIQNSGFNFVLESEFALTQRSDFFSKKYNFKDNGIFDQSSPDIRSVYYLKPDRELNFRTSYLFSLAEKISKEKTRNIRLVNRKSSVLAPLRYRKYYLHSVGPSTSVEIGKRILTNSRSYDYTYLLNDQEVANISSSKVAAGQLYGNLKLGFTYRIFHYKEFRTENYEHHEHFRTHEFHIAGIYSAINRLDDVYHKKSFNNPTQSSTLPTYGYFYTRYNINDRTLKGKFGLEAYYLYRFNRTISIKAHFRLNPKIGYSYLIQSGLTFSFRLNQLRQNGDKLIPMNVFSRALLKWQNR
jgi:hypothetical protein